MLGLVVLGQLPGGADERVERLTAAGIEKLVAGDLRQAEILFKAARNLDPQNGRVRQWLGRTLLRRGFPERALEEFLFARQLGIETAEIDLDLASCLLELRRVDEALELASAVEERTRSWSAAELLGLAHFQKEDHSEARRWFLEAVARSDPNEELVVYHLARTFEALGETEAALDSYRRLLLAYPAGSYSLDARERLDRLRPTRPPEPPEPPEAAEAPEPEPEPEPEGPRPWTIRLTLAGGFNDNVILRGEDQVLAPEIARQEAGVFIESLLASYLFRFDESTTIQVSDAVSWTQYVDLHEFNTLVHSPQMSLNHAFSREWRSQVAVSWTDVWVDDERFQDQWDFSGKVQWQPEFAPWSSTTLAYTHSRFDYFGSIPSDFERDGFGNTIRVTERILVPETDLSVTLGHEHGWFRTEGSQFDRNIDRVSVGLGHPVPPIPDVYASVDFSYSWFHYRHTDLRTAGNQHRRDEILSVGASLGWQVSRNLRVFTSFEFAKSLSNNDLFQYERHQYLAGIQIEF